MSKKTAEQLATLSGDQVNELTIELKSICTERDELKPRNMEIEELFKKQESVNDTLMKSVQVSKV